MVHTMATEDIYIYQGRGRGEEKEWGGGRGGDEHILLYLLS